METSSRFIASSVTTGMNGTSVILTPIEDNSELNFNRNNASHNIALHTSLDGKDAFVEGNEYIVTIEEAQ